MVSSMCVSVFPAILNHFITRPTKIHHETTTALLNDKRVVRGKSQIILWPIEFTFSVIMTLHSSFKLLILSILMIEILMT